MDSTTKTSRSIETIVDGHRKQVGDGFHIHSPLPSQELQQVGPILLLDHAGPTLYPPTERPRGVDQHPHRGFETVTIVYQGQLEHRDSAGNQGKIGPGDVQWMTAASGVVHEEKHERAFARRGGTLEMIQLWVNLPSWAKMTPPRYQSILDAQIPAIMASDGLSRVRVISGQFDNAQGPAYTVTPVTMLDITMQPNARLTIPLPTRQTIALYILRGSVRVGSSALARQHQLVMLASGGNQVMLVAEAESQVLLLGGEPLNEPVANHGPFVMNTTEELHQAIADYQSGKMGTLPPNY